MLRFEQWVEATMDESNEFAKQFLAFVKEKHPNAKLTTSAEKRAETAELMKKRIEAAKNAPKAKPVPYEDKYPLGGYDPVSHRSYSD